ncbi:hypothetical protein HTV45_06310 [Streptomyces sp. CHD11]|uniref:DUF6215 domain-containing protein n=1 Tax=Streptomyces sp. CHD11 TaxID=2741325 RepID=UPI001BFCBB08|nr:DUF6215 domain-containing protein [Streptomyces sp. CHD11]MBT3150502.1 hypothetical protein [Streptomyces sp. CHD11]
MLGFLLRRLPFWVREPLLIVVGSVLGARLIYLALHDEEWVPAGIGVAFLVFTVVRVHLVVRALRARGNPGPAAAEGGPVSEAAAQPQPQPQPQAPAGQRPTPAAAEKEPNAWGQAAAAVALFAAIGAVLWLEPELLPSQDAGTPQAAAASCASTEEEELPSAYRRTAPRAVTGDELCEALNRSGLATLLGTPAERATSASGTSGTAPLTDGKVAQPEAQVRFDTYTVHVSATYNELSIAQYVKLMEFGDETGIRTLSVHGRPAVLFSDHTMKIEIDLGSGGSGGPVEEGPLARTLSVALDGGDRGGFFDITVWSASGALPEDSALLGIAGSILPVIAERTA